MSLPSKTRHRKQGEAFCSVLSLLVPQARGQTSIDFEVVGEVMKAKAVFLDPGIHAVQGVPLQQIEVQPIGGAMQLTGR